VEISDRKKKEGIFCCAYGCNNDPVPKKGGLCHKHYKRKLNETDPVQVRYNVFKAGAKRRGKQFLITLKEFRQFCDETGYLSPGKRGKNCTIDRIDINKGYELGNMQLLTNRQNVKKYYDYDRYHYKPPENHPTMQPQKAYDPDEPYYLPF